MRARGDKLNYPQKHNYSSSENYTHQLVRNAFQGAYCEV